jgi:heme-degrading monooxygenase HmoA
MVIDVTTFRLTPGTAEDDFLAADRRWQTELVPNRPGFVRRTTAHRDGEWAVITLWSTEADAVAFEADTAGHEARQAFDQHVAAESRHAVRFDTLD